MNTRISRMMRILFPVISAIITFGCTSDNGEPYENEIPSKENIYYRAIELSDNSVEVNQGVADFSYRLFKSVNSLNSGDFLISPFSISTSLSMLANGATEEKQTEILKMLGVVSLEHANNYYRQLVQDLPSHTNSVVLKLANSVWIPQSCSLGSGFSKTIGTVYEAECSTLTSDSKENAGLVNSWVNEKTNSLIPHIVDYIDGFALVNTIYMKGQWSEPFDRSLTHQTVFHNGDGSETGISMMSRTGFRYGMYDGVEAATLDIGRGYQAIFLTSNRMEVNDLVDWLDRGRLAEIDDESHSFYSGGVLSIPKFSLDYHDDVAGILDILNGKSLLAGQGIFDNIAKGLFLNQVIHGCSYSMDEDGMEAASATVVDGYLVNSNDNVDLIFDRPFIFIIRSISGQIMFMGKKTHG